MLPSVCTLCALLLHTVAVVGLQPTSYQVSENAGAVMVCVAVSSPDIACPIAFPFNVKITTLSGSAGNNADLIENIHVHVIL